jgi:hypothetical protein
MCVRSVVLAVLVTQHVDPRVNATLKVSHHKLYHCCLGSNQQQQQLCQQRQPLISHTAATASETQNRIVRSNTSTNCVPPAVLCVCATMTASAAALHEPEQKWGGNSRCVLVFNPYSTQRQLHKPAKARNPPHNQRVLLSEVYTHM